MDCDRSKALVPVYLDGELGEELAGPLRRHLMECGACRARVAEAKSLSGWFVPGPEVQAPTGFAARVADLAFAGAGAAPALADTLVPAAPRERRVAATPVAGRQGDRVLRFAMGLTAAAAGLLFGLTLLLARGDRQDFEGEGLKATESIERSIQQLEELNRLEAERAAAAAAAAAPAEGAPAPEAGSGR